MVNPFRDTIVTDPWESTDIDVPEINIDAFELCCEALDVVRAEGRTTSVLLYGEAGSGKTHLLGRLRTHLRQQTQFHVFVSVRMQSSPHRFWRHIRKCFVESLMRRVYHGRSQLDLVFLRRLYMLLAQYSKKKKSSVKELCQFIESLSFKANLSRNLCKALECLVTKRHRLDVIAWLKGDSLPESALMNLDLAQDNEESDYPEDCARGFIMELCRLAGPTMPLIFCFDQIEALRRYPGDSDGLFVFGQAMRSLHDETNNVLLISCIQSFFHEELRNAVMDPDYTALAIHKRTLNPLTREESLKLVWARLEGSPDLTGKKSELHLAFKKDLERYVGPSGQTARNVLSRCADLYDYWEKDVPLERGQSRPRQSDEEFLNEEKARREEQAIKDTTPERTDEIVQSALPVIINVMDKRWKEQDRKRPLDVDIVLEGPGLKVGISLCNQKNMTSLAARLRRIRSQFMDSDMDRLLLVRHPQLPISAGAKKVKEYLQDLMEQNVRLINPDIEALAALEALRGLLGDAKSGDLANSGKPVGDGAVRDWLKRQLSGPALDFVDQVLTSHAIIADDSEIFQDLLELLDQERVIKLNDVAKKTGADFKRLQAAVRQHPGQIGYIEGPPPVIFQFIPEGAQVS